MISPTSLALQVRRLLEEADAIWTYKGSPNKDQPHALLTSGLHSNGYADVGTFLKTHAEERLRIASWLLSSAQQNGARHFTRVVGADTSSTLLAEDLARLAEVRPIFMQKIEDAEGKRQAWDSRNDPLRETDSILHIEELITTASSAIQVRDGIALAHPGLVIHYESILPVIVDRSNPVERITHIGDSYVLPLLRLQIQNYPPNNCPYCRAGSQAIKPKERDNWSLLTGKSKASR